VFEQRIQKLKAALRDVSPDVRSAAARSIERLQAQASLDRFRDILQGQDTAAKLRALYGLAELDGDEPLKLIVTALGDETPDVRCTVIRILGEKSDPRTLGPLFEQLDDPDPAIRSLVIESLGNFRDKRLADSFLSMLSTEDPDILSRIVTALGRLGEKRAEEAFVKLLAHPQAAVREAAAGALGLIGA